MRFPGIAPACAAILVIASPAWAQEATGALPDAIALPALLRLVAERSPRLAAERVAIDAARAERIGAAALPNPSISVGRFKPAGGARTVFDGSSQQQVSVDFPLLVANQRSARVEAADQAVLAAQAHVGMAGSELAVQAAERFIGLQAAQEKALVMEAALVEARRLSAIVEGRVSSGVATRYELTRVEVELAGLTGKLDEARVERATRSASLGALLGVANWRPSALGTAQPAGLPAEATHWSSALSQRNAQVLAARRDEAAAQAALERAGRERWPVPVLSVGRTWTSEPFGAANFVGLSTEIPLLDKRLGPVAKAEADLRAAQRRREATEAEAEADLVRMLETLAQRRAALEQFERNIAGRLGMLKEMAEDFYQLGRGSILDLIDAARSRLEAQLTGVDLRAAAAEQEMRILALGGMLRE